MPLVAIICDGGGAFGFGNLRRSATLGAEFKRRGYRVSVKAVSERARGLLPEFPADQGEADLWLLDVPYNGDTWVAGGAAPRSSGGGAGLRRQCRPRSCHQHLSRAAPGRAARRPGVTLLDLITRSSNLPSRRCRRRPPAREFLS